MSKLYYGPTTSGETRVGLSYLRIVAEGPKPALRMRDCCGRDD